MQSRNLAESNISFSFGAVFGFLDIENTFFIVFYAFVVFSSVAQVGFAKEIFACDESYSDYNLLSFLNQNFYWQHYVNHFSIYIDIAYFKLNHLFRPAVRTQFYFIKTFKVHTFPIILKHLIHTKSSKLYIFVRNKRNSIISFFICNITKSSFWSINLFESMEYFWSIYSSF